MAIVKADLLAFNNIETTDALQGIVELPHFKRVAYIPGRTYSTEYEDIVIAKGQRGSQAIVRKLGKGTVKSVKATVANAFDFAHENTADDIEIIPIDDVLSKSEKIYEAVDIARVSETGAKKAEVVLNDLIEHSQGLISGYLTASVPAMATPVKLTTANIYEKVLEAFGKVDNATTLMVTGAVYNLLLHLVTTGQFIANSREESFRTGVLGTILGLDVVRDDHLDHDFVLYNFEAFPVFNPMSVFHIVDARPDFVGSYAQAQGLQGGGRTPMLITDPFLWGVKYKYTA